MIEGEFQLVFAEGRGDPWLCPELLGRVDLVIVPVLAEGRPARQDHDRSSVLQCRQDRSHAGVGDHQFAVRQAPIESRGVHPLSGLEVRRSVLGVADLAERFDLRMGAYPFVDGPDESIERALRSNGEEDQNTVPR